MEFSWDLSVNEGDVGIKICLAVQNYIRNTFNEQFPDLLHFISFKGTGYNANFTFKDDFFIFYMEDTNSQIPVIGNFDDDLNLSYYQNLLEIELKEYSYSEIIAKVGQYFSFNKFALIGKLVDGKACWKLISSFITEWLDDKVLPQILSLNERSIRRVVKNSPSYSPQDLLSGVCILECEESMKQGTGFVLKDFGIITCSHVLGSNTKLFFASHPAKMYDIEIIKKNEELDLAILSLTEKVKVTEFEKGSCDIINQLDHLMISGFPNYRIGDSGLLTPGLVTGFRTILGIRRLITNAPIIAGNSGGPVFNKDSKVIGIAVTGSDSLSSSQNTEDHGIIPIEALNYLK